MGLPAEIGLDLGHQALEVVGRQAAHPAEPGLASSQLRDDAAYVERVGVPAEKRHGYPYSVPHGEDG